MVARALELVALVGSNNTTKNLQVLGEPLNLSLVDVLNALGLPQSGLIDYWLQGMDVGGSSYTPYENPSDAEGIGLWEAPRGSLLHWIKINNSKTQNYQVVAPTTWNVCPNGPLETALVGTPVGTSGTSADLLSTAFVVRSFDLCLACTVHTVDAKGKEQYLKDLMRLGKESKASRNGSRKPSQGSTSRTLHASGSLACISRRNNSNTHGISDWVAFSE